MRIRARASGWVVLLVMSRCTPTGGPPPGECSPVCASSQHCEAAASTCICDNPCTAAGAVCDPAGSGQLGTCALEASTGCYVVTGLAACGAAAETCAAGATACAAPDTTPPRLSDGAPSGILAAGTTQATLSVTTDEPATCRWDLTVDADYPSLANAFDVTGGTSHSSALVGLADDTDYAVSVRCVDGAGNSNPSGYTVEFGVAPPVDTTPPVMANGAPTGVLAAGTASVTMTIATDEPATCKWGINDLAYATMANAFSNSGGTLHSTTLNGLVNGQTYPHFVRCRDTSGNVNTVSFPISFSVGTAVDTTPPVISDGEPSGTVTMGTTSATMSVTTDEAATCKWDTVTSTAYAAMPNTFTTTGGTAHSTTLTGLVNGQAYNRFVRCSDGTGNANPASYAISFNVASVVDTTPPVISSGAPSGVLAIGTTQVTMSVTTDEAATCKWGVNAATGYAGLANTFTTTGGTNHRVTLNGLVSGTTYSRFVRCSDGSGNANPTSYAITFSIGAIKSNYGHYVATKYSDTPAQAAALCEKPGVTGINWRQTWAEVEKTPGAYTWTSFEQVLAAIAASSNKNCQVWLFIEWKSFANSPVKDPCPAYLSAYSGLNANGSGAKTCFMWEPTVRDAYGRMIAAAGLKYDGNPRIEGLTFEESSLSLNGAYSQSPPNGTYSGAAFKDALVDLIGKCDTAFPHSRCLSFLNFLDGGQQYLYQVSAALEGLANNRGCMGGPDLLPGNTTLYLNDNRVYEVLMRHTGCRSNSAQNDSFDDDLCKLGGVPSLQCIFNFAVRGTFGDFNDGVRSTVKPRDPSSGVCVNSYLFWNNRTAAAPSTGFTIADALPIIAANPYGTGWYGQCPGGGNAPP